MLNWLIISYNLCRNKCEKHNNCSTEEKLHRIYNFAVVNALIGRCNNNLSGYRTDYHRYKNVHYHSASLEQALFSFWNIISVRSSKKSCHNKFYPQLGVKLCSMAGGGVQKIYMVLLREPSRRDRSGSDLFHLRDGFEIKMNFDRNVSCFIFVNALMHDDFFD